MNNILFLCLFLLFFFSATGDSGRKQHNDHKETTTEVIDIDNTNPHLQLQKSQHQQSLQVDVNDHYAIQCHVKLNLQFPYYDDEVGKTTNLATALVNENMISWILVLESLHRPQNLQAQDQGQVEVPNTKVSSSPTTSFERQEVKLSFNSSSFGDGNSTSNLIILNDDSSMVQVPLTFNNTSNRSNKNVIHFLVPLLKKDQILLLTLLMKKGAEDIATDNNRVLTRRLIHVPKKSTIETFSSSLSRDIHLMSNVTLSPLKNFHRKKEEDKTDEEKLESRTGANETVDEPKLDNRCNKLYLKLESEHEHEHEYETETELQSYHLTKLVNETRDEPSYTNQPQTQQILLQYQSLSLFTPFIILQAREYQDYNLIFFFLAFFLSVVYISSFQYFKSNKKQRRDSKKQQQDQQHITITATSTNVNVGTTIGIIDTSTNITTTDASPSLVQMRETDLVRNVMSEEEELPKNSTYSGQLLLCTQPQTQQERPDDNIITHTAPTTTLNEEERITLPTLLEEKNDNNDDDFDINTADTMNYLPFQCQTSSPRDSSPQAQVQQLPSSPTKNNNNNIECERENFYDLTLESLEKVYSQYQADVIESISGIHNENNKMDNNSHKDVDITKNNVMITTTTTEKNENTLTTQATVTTTTNNTPKKQKKQLKKLDSILKRKGRFQSMASNTNNDITGSPLFTANDEEKDINDSFFFDQQRQKEQGQGEETPDYFAMINSSLVPADPRLHLYNMNSEKQQQVNHTSIRAAGSSRHKSGGTSGGILKRRRPSQPLSTSPRMRFAATTESNNDTPCEKSTTSNTATSFIQKIDASSSSNDNDSPMDASFFFSPLLIHGGNNNVDNEGRIGAGRDKVSLSIKSTRGIIQRKKCSTNTSTSAKVNRDTTSMTSTPLFPSLPPQDISSTFNNNIQEDLVVREKNSKEEKEEEILSPSSFTRSRYTSTQDSCQKKKKALLPSSPHSTTSSYSSLRDVILRKKQTKSPRRQRERLITTLRIQSPQHNRRTTTNRDDNISSSGIVANNDNNDNKRSPFRVVAQEKQKKKRTSSSPTDAITRKRPYTKKDHTITTDDTTDHENNHAHDQIMDGINDNYKNKNNSSSPVLDSLILEADLKTFHSVAVVANAGTAVSSSAKKKKKKQEKKSITMGSSLSTKDNELKEKGDAPVATNNKKKSSSPPMTSRKRTHNEMIQNDDDDDVEKFNLMMVQKEKLKTNTRSSSSSLSSLKKKQNESNKSTVGRSINSETATTTKQAQEEKLESKVEEQSYQNHHYDDNNTESIFEITSIAVPIQQQQEQMICSDSNSIPQDRVKGMNAIIHSSLEKKKKKKKRGTTNQSIQSSSYHNDSVSGKDELSTINSSSLNLGMINDNNKNNKRSSRLLAADVVLSNPWFFLDGGNKRKRRVVDRSGRLSDYSFIVVDDENENDSSSVKASLSSSKRSRSSDKKKKKKRRATT